MPDDLRSGGCRALPADGAPRPGGLAGGDAGVGGRLPAASRPPHALPRRDRAAHGRLLGRARGLLGGLARRHHLGLRPRPQPTHGRGTDGGQLQLVFQVGH